LDGPETGKKSTVRGENWDCQTRLGLPRLVTQLTDTVSNRVCLPAIGLLLFALITRDAVQRHYPSRYFDWSGIRLDSRPGQPVATTCGDHMKDCFEITDPIIDSGLFAKTLLVLTIPAFFVGSGLVRGLDRVGISEILTFFLVMPLLMGTWLYFLGWLVDRTFSSRCFIGAADPTETFISLSSSPRTMHRIWLPGIALGKIY